MAVNLLTITKEPNDYFTFVLNGDTVNAIKNTRNDLLTIGNFCHFKTSNGANLIKEQNVIYSNITIIDGVALPAPISVDDLFDKLKSVGFFDWINGTGTGGVDRFDELADTFQYFGKDGQVPRVNESQLKLEAFVMPDVSKLDAFPSPLIANKILRVKADGTAYEFVDLPAGTNGYVQAFDYVSPDPQTFALATTANLISVVVNGALADPNDWTQAGNILTIINYTLVTNDRIIVTGII